MNAPVKSFSWSWSRLKNYRACPKRHYHVDIRKDFREVESEALLNGNRFHDVVAKRVSHGAALPAGDAVHDKWPSLLNSQLLRGCDISVELSLAIDRNFKATGWFDKDTWLRAKVDALAVDGDFRYAVAFDWKTGKHVEPEYEQLQITAQMLFSHHPGLKEVHTAYYWSQHSTEIMATYKPHDTVVLWGKLLPEIKQMEEAHRTTTYPPKPSGLCIRYCPVTSCPYHGKGSR